MDPQDPPLTNAQADNKQLRIQNRQLQHEKERLEIRIAKLAEELSDCYAEIDRLNGELSPPEKAE